MTTYVASASVNFVLRHIRKRLNVENATIQGNALIDIQFNFVALIWMFCRETKITIKLKQKPFDIQQLCLYSLKVSSIFSERYLKAGLKSIQSSCGRSLSRKSYVTVTELKPTTS